MTPVDPEFSRLVSVARIPPKGIEEHLEAKPAERAALAQRFDLIDLPVLKASLTLAPAPQGTFEATGTLEAQVTQRCVVTLEPIERRLKVTLDVIFVPAEQNEDPEKAAQMDALDNEFELFSGGKIDIGEMVAQQLGINIDPYPRKAGAALPVTESGPKIEEIKPLAKAMAALKNSKKDDKTVN